MICVNCGHQQASGKFCGKCGTKFESTGVQPEVAATGAQPTEPVPNQSMTAEPATTTVETEQPTATPIAPAEPNVYIENTKQKSKLYFKYFMQQLKEPALAKNQGEAQYSNGLISICLLAILIGLTFFAAIGSASSYAPSFLSIFIGMLVFSLAAMGLVVVTLWLINNFFGPQHSFKSIISLYGGHLSPVLLVGIASLLLMLLKSYTFGSFTLFLVFIFSITLLPLYLISVLLTKKSSGLDPLYGYIIYIVAFSIFIMILMFILADSTIGGLLENFEYYF